MTDKVQKIREEVVRMHNLLPAMDSYNISVNYADRICTTLEMYIDSMQKEEIPPKFPIISQKKCMFTKDSYTDEDRKILCKDCEEECEYAQKEEPVSEGLKIELEKYIKDHFTIDKEQLDRFGIEEKDYMYSMDKSDMLALVEHFTNWQKTKDSIVSEDLEEASKEWLKPQLDKSYADYGETKMMELTHFDGYAMLDAIEFGAKWQKKRDYIPLSDNINEVARQICNKVLNCEIDYKEDDVVLSDEEECVKAGIRWQMQKEAIPSKDLEELINSLSKQFPEVSFAKLSRIAVRVAKWQKENIWKPADGDDLPEIDREVVVFTQNFPNDVGMMSVAIAHRPNPDGWDGKSLSTGKVEHYTPKTYDKGGWNIPNVKWWLDCLIPNMEE